MEGLHVEVALCSFGISTANKMKDASTEAVH
jgi:hypothetical protein